MSESKPSQIQIPRLQIIGVCLAGFGALLLLYGIPIISEASKTSSWPYTEGYITHSQVGYFQSGNVRAGGSHYTANVEYQYQVGGQGYTGNRVRSAQDDFPFAYFANRTVESYPVGKKVAVFYSPDVPSLAVLESGIHLADFNIVILALVLCVGGIFIYRRVKIF
jgi:hypothetical protein